MNSLIVTLARFAKLLFILCITKIGYSASMGDGAIAFNDALALQWNSQATQQD